MKIPTYNRKVILLLLLFLFVISTIFTVTVMQQQTITRQDAATLPKESYRWRHVPIGDGGYTRAVVAHPTNPHAVFLRTDVGGAYRWQEDAQQWEQLITFPQYAQSDLFAVESIGIDPTNREGTIVYIALGKGTVRTYTGVYKSIDGGHTWTKDPLPGTNTIKINGGGQASKQGERIAVDPNNSNVVYYATRENGLWKTTDGGGNFAQIPSFTDKGGPAQGDFQGPQQAGLSFVVFNTSSGVVNSVTKNLYVGSAGKGVWQSTDGGTTWSLMANSPPYPIRATINSAGVVYVSHLDGVAKYNGTSWVDVTPKDANSDITPSKGTDLCPAYPKDTAGVVGHAEYAGISVDPRMGNSQNITVIKSCQSSGNNRIYHSTNGGLDWKVIGAANSSFINLTTTYTPSSHFIIYASGLVLDAAGRVWATDGESIWRTSDINAVPTSWERVYKGHEETVINNIKSLSNGNLITTTSDVQGFLHTDLITYPTKKLAPLLPFNDIGTFDTQESDPTFIVIGGSNRNNNGPNDPKGNYYSTDSGTTWTQLPSIQNSFVAGRLAVSANSRRIVWVPEDERPYFIDPGSTSWTSATGPFDTSCRAIPEYWGHENYDVLAADKVTGNIFYLYEPTDSGDRDANGNAINCGKLGGKLLKSTDGGKTFTAIKTFNFTGFSNRPRINVKTVPGKANHVWLAVQGGSSTCSECGLLRSEDGGATFTKVNTIKFVQTVGFSTTAPGKTFPSVFIMGKVASTYDAAITNEEHVFRSDDQGNTWMVVDNPGTPLWNGNGVLEGSRTRYDSVFIGTAGNGVLLGEQTVLPTLTSSPPPQTVKGDMNNDDKIDLNDYARFICEYPTGMCKNAAGMVTSTLSSDLNKNGVIDIGDFQLWLNSLL